MTLGEQRVKTDFNIGKSDTVANLKNTTAHMINDCEKMRYNESGEYLTTPGIAEKHRLISLAQEAYEQAAMWAVKAYHTK
jgi:hypothetical protein